MSTAQIKHALDQMEVIGVCDLSITGGEPLLRRDALEILKYAAQKEGFISLSLNTNGLLINDEVICFFEEHCPNLNIVISLDGHTPKSYSILRRSRLDTKKVLYREFAHVTGVLCKLAQSKLKASVNYVITQPTVPNFLPTYDLIRSLGLRNILAIKFFPYGAGRRYRDDLELSYPVWRDFIVGLTTIKSQNSYYQGIEVSITCPWEIYAPLLNEGLSLEFINHTWNYNSPLQSELYRRGRDVGCHAGYTSCAISPNGDVYPCGTISAKFPPLVCGNLNRQSFGEIWFNSPVFQSLRSLDLAGMQGHCPACHLKELCGGGCRLRAYAQYFDFNAVDYLCPIQEAHEKSRTCGR